MAILEKNDADFENSIEKGFYVVDFYGENCGPCRFLAETIKNVEAEMPFVDFIELNTTQNTETAEKYDVRAVPTLLLVRDGAVLDRKLGYMDNSELSEWIGRYLYS